MEAVLEDRSFWGSSWRSELGAR
uniref:Uncharacterized protein n=1 Tax=Rhizophora mucronata TaxID=61149 RepID=A0A2P2PP19_RHIMU